MDTATIQLAGMAYNSAMDIESKIKRGDPVQIQLGYNETGLYDEFEGFVVSMKTDDTIEIICEDSMYNFRKEIESKQYTDVSLREIIEDIASQIGGYQIEISKGVRGIKYDSFVVDNATGIEVLKKIQEENKIHIFVKKKTLYVYLKYEYKEGKVSYDFSKNTEKVNLNYLQEKDKKVLVEVVGIQKDNTKISVLAGNKGGDKITIHRYNVSEKSTLQTIANEELKRYLLTGYEGDITAWLIPYCSYGHTAKVFDKNYINRQGSYYVEAVTTTVSDRGGERKVNLGIKLS